MKTLSTFLRISKHQPCAGVDGEGNCASFLARWLVALTAIMMAKSGSAQTTSYSPIVGFVKVEINGTDTGSGHNFVGPALVSAEAFRGKLDAGLPSANSLTVSTAAWSPNQFDTHATANSHYVEIIASSNAAAIGLFTDIVSHTGTTLTTQANLAAQLVGGETIVIRKHKTVGDVFGASNDAGLGAGEASSADTVSVMTSGTSAVFNSVYFKTGGLGGSGWRNTTDPFTDQSTMPLKLGEGLLVQRKLGGAVPLILKGYIHEGALQLPLKTGYNLIDPLAPLTDQTTATPTAGPAFTLGGTASGSQIPSSLDSVFAPGDPTTADLLNVYDGAFNFSTFYRRSGGLGGAGWRATSNPFVTEENAIVPSAAALLIELKSPPALWNRPQPFATAP